MVRKMIGICALAVLALLVSTGIAKADGVDTFTYQSGGNTYVWQLPDSPSPDSGDVYPGDGFLLNNVEVSENGGARILGSFGFYTAICAGGFDLTVGDNSMITTGWVPLYSGPEWSPTFLPGTYDLTDYAIDNTGCDGTLVIATPEPSGISLLGLGLLAVLLRFHSKKLVASQTRA
jgi:hypothetical protein